MVKAFRYLLLPISFLYGLIVGLRNVLFNNNILKSSEFDVKTILVGNIAAGGTGKTPHVEYLIRLLSNKKLATLSRGYGRKDPGFQQANKESTADSIGDEPLQFYTKHPEVNVFVDTSRVSGIIGIMSKEEIPEVVLLDDAFQHRSLKTGFSILLTDYNAPFYKDFMLPTGNLREFTRGKKRADVIIVSKCPSVLSDAEKQQITEKIDASPEKKVFFTTVKYGSFNSLFNLEEQVDLKGKELIVVTGIAKSEPFINHLTKNNNISKHFNFPDHHRFTDKNIQEIIFIFERNKDSVIVTTEKDAMRLKEQKALESLPIFYLPIEVDFIQDKEIFEKLIHNYVESD
ncbi:MAG: tetraacyldisaccharide 4'-kinase [Flavobacteriales bacterium]|nr:tetraacyldisaccharide 4'-kinase [Flavobacteriales bacterium]